MNVSQWSRVEPEVLGPLSRRQVIHTDRVTIARFDLRKGAQVLEHSHPNEQISMIQSGRILFVLPGEERILESGDILRIPPNVPHSAEALEDCVAVDIFSPRREDWLRGEDAYLRGA